MDRLDLGGLSVDVVRKEIKHLHLSVYPPAGRVRISAPMKMRLESIRVYAISKLAWIRSQQGKILSQARELPHEYLNRESHHVWGRRYLLEVVECEAVPTIALQHSKLVLQVRPGATRARRHELLDAWYREQVKAALPALRDKWEPLMKVRAGRFFVQRLKTMWGSCNPTSGSIRLNTDLAKKSPECLEYIMVHEMAHLIEPTHGARFVALMDRYLPNWAHRRAMLNRLPVRHDSWSY